MKILIYAWSLSNGGSERVASLWAQGFANNGNSVSVVLGSFCSRLDYNLPPNIKVMRQSKVYDLWQRIMPQKLKEKFFSSKYCDKIYNIIPSFIRVWLTSRIIKEENPDIIITISTTSFKRLKAAVNICKYNIPVVVTAHNAFERPEYAPFTSQQYSEKFIVSRSYDFLTVLTEADRRVLVEKMDASFMKKVYVLPNPLTFVPQPNIPQKEKVILAAGRLDVWHCKGFDLLLKAWAKVCDTFPQWKLKIAGGGDKSTLIRICDELKIKNRVDFLGFVDIKKQYELAEVFVLSSRYEGFGMVLIEAMSQGCACIACDYKGRQREIIADDTQGIICPIDDENAIADALCKVITDDNYRLMLQKNAIERSKYYELPNIMHRWDEIFKDLNVKKEL